MKVFFRIIKYRFLSNLKHPAVLVCLIFSFIGSIVVGIYAEQSKSDGVQYPIAIVNEDEGTYADKFIEQMMQNEQVDIVILDIEKARKQVATGKIDGAFVLLSGFSDSIKRSEYKAIVKIISPPITTSAYPVSEIVSAEIITLWLKKMVESTIYEMYKELGNDVEISYDELNEKKFLEYSFDKIIDIEYIGDMQIQETIPKSSPLSKATGLYAVFAFFAVMLSSEWVFDIKKRSLQNRFLSINVDISIVCLATQIASILVCYLFFIPLVSILAIYCAEILIIDVLVLSLGIGLYLVCICSMAFAISTFVENLAQLLIVGTSVSIINMMISSLIIPLPTWAIGANFISKAFPGYYLSRVAANAEQLVLLLIVTCIWIFIGYLCSIRMKSAKTSS